MAFNSKNGLLPVDLIFVMIVFISILMMFVVIGYTLTDSVKTSLDTTGDFNTSSLTDTLNTFKLFNTGIPFIFFSFIIISIILAISIKTSSAISIFMILIISVIGYIAQGMSNMMFEFTRNSALTNASNQLSFGVTLMDNLPLFILIGGVAIMIFMFAKPKSYEV
jgi:hypothetical protein